MIGFIIQTFGTLLFNEIIVIPIFGFDQNLFKNQVYEKLIEEETDISQDQTKVTKNFKSTFFDHSKESFYRIL